MLRTSTLRPGFLVSLKTSVSGNVTYRRRDLEPGRVREDGAHEAKWETERRIQDPKEHERALEARSQAAYRVRKICAKSAFGLLCPEAQAADLETAIAEAREISEAFNETAALTRVEVFVLTGRIAPDDVEAMKAINSEVRDLLREMQDGVEALDVKRIRDAASRTKQLGTMLTADAAGRIAVAVEAARTAATKLAKAGEQAAREVDRGAILRITEARTAFLDLDDAAEMKAPAIEGRAIDLDPDVQRASDEYIATAKREAAGIPQIELEL